MDNEDRLRAMRWAAAKRLELNKGDKWERRRCELAVEMIDREFEQAALGFVMQEAKIVGDACVFQSAVALLDEGIAIDDMA